MTRDEFDQWTQDLCRKFPVLGGWFRDMKAASGPLLGDWFSALSDCDLGDCLNVNRRMLAGDEDGPGKFASDWQTIPATVRRAASREAFRRMNSREAADIPDFNEPRYTCLDCRDCGFISVAHYEMFRAWRSGTLVDCIYRTASALCPCGKIPVARDDWALQRQAALYDPKWHFKIPWTWAHWEGGRDEPRRLEHLTEYAEWCETTWAAWQARNRRNEFDSFNERAFA